VNVDRAKSKVQEDLIALYLRLTGFFVSPFIVHSPVQGRNFTEIDALAVRLPFSSEPERLIGPDAVLNLSTRYTDLVLCEVKSNGKKPRFNPALVARPTAVETVLRWSGLFHETEIAPVARELIEAMRNPSSDSPPTAIGPRGVRVRALAFLPERGRRPNQGPWFIEGPVVMHYIWQCLCPKAPRQSCATTYDLQLWRDLEPLVRYFKSRCMGEDAGNMKDLYAFVGCDLP
jgi:hypothetical protein